MKGIEIDSSQWSDEQRKMAFAKLEELGYEPINYHGTEYYNGKKSISAYYNGVYCGYDISEMLFYPYDITPTFEELMQMKKEDVK